MARPADKGLIFCLLATIALSLIVCSRDGYLAAGQPQQPHSTRTRPPVRPQRTKSTASATPTPTPSAVDRLGEAPPPMRLRPPKSDLEVNPGDVIKVETTEVMLPVTVRDPSGNLVADLTRNDFRVFEDNQAQPLQDLALRQVPVDAVLMVDASSSAARNLEDFRRAAEGFAERLGPDDRISLMTFDDTVKLLQDWTSSRFQLRRALTRIEPGMFTRFNDALLLAAHEQFGSTRSRRAAIVLTDGIDSGRGATLESALRALLEAQVAVYIVSNTEISRAAKQAELDSLARGTESAQRFNKLQIDGLQMELSALDQSERQLQQLAAATGGRLYKPKSFDDLEATYGEVANELRHQYALYFTPINKKRDGSFRRVRVETTNPNYQPLTRVGYFAPKG